MPTGRWASGSPQVREFSPEGSTQPTDRLEKPEAPSKSQRHPALASQTWESGHLPWAA